MSKAWNCDTIEYDITMRQLVMKKECEKSWWLRLLSVLRWWFCCWWLVVYCSVVGDLLFIVTLIVGVCNCSVFCCTLLYVHSSFAIILMGKRKLVDLLSLSSWCLVIVVWLFLVVPWVCLQFVIVVFPDLTHLLFLTRLRIFLSCIVYLLYLSSSMLQKLNGKIF